MAVLKLTLLVFAVTLVSSAGIPASLRRGDGAARSSIVVGSSTGVAATRVFRSAEASNRP